MRRGQTSVEAVIAVVLLALAVSAGAVAAGRCWERAHRALAVLHAEAETRRAQGVVEVLALAPLIGAAAIAFALACGQVVATGRAESALARAEAAAAAGVPRPPAPAGVRIERRGDRVLAVVVGPVSAVTVDDRALP